MGCLCAIKTDEYHGFECSISGEHVCISILIQKDVQESTEKVRMLGILKI